MPGYLRIDETWVQVTGVSVPQTVDYATSVIIQTTLGGRRRAQVQDTPAHRDWQIRLGLANATTLYLWERLIDRVYGVGPFDWVDPLKAAAAEATNGPGTDGGPPPGAVVRPVVVAAVGRADRRATLEQQLTAITVTLAEVGPGVS